MQFIPTFQRSNSTSRQINKEKADYHTTAKPNHRRRGLLIATFLLALAAFGGYAALASAAAHTPFWGRLISVWRSPFAPSAAQTVPLAKSAIQVDPGNTKQTGATFGYRLTYNCSNTSGPCLGAEVVDLLPPEVQQISTVPASPTGDVAAIQVTPNFMGSGRTRVRFQLISPLPAGNSGDLIINVRFPNGATPDGTVATNTADGINLDTAPGTLTTPPVTVTAVATVQVNLQKTLTTSPANLDMPEAYRLRISVPNSNGALNLTSIGPVTDTLPPGTVFNGATPAADCQPGCVGTTPATVTWTSPCAVPLQPNQNCDINVNVTFPSATFPSGTNVTNSFTAGATPLGEPPQTFGPGQVTHPVTTFVPNPSAGFTKNMAGGTPNPPTLNQTFSYDLNTSNNGNVPLDNMIIVDTLPVEMQVASVTTGAYTGLADFAAGEGVRVNYEKNTALGVFTLWGSSPNTTTNTTLIAPPPGLGAGEYLTRIRWEYGQAQPGMSNTARPLITGRIVNPDNAGGPVAFGDTIQNCANLSAVYTAGPTNVNVTDCESFNLSGPFAQLNPAKENLSGGGPFNPGQTVSWRLRVRSAAQSSDPLPLENVVAADLLPINLLFSSWTFDDRGTGLPAPQVFDQLPNYAGTGRTLLRWRWNAGSGNLGVNQEVWVNITTTIRNGAPAGSLSNDVTLDSDAPGLGLRCTGSSQTDALDLDGDGNTAETLCRATGTISVAGIAQLISSKTVQGVCDGGYVATSAGTLNGGSIKYLIRVQNVGTVPMQNFVLVDILPFVGDTGVRDTNPRGSLFTPLLVEPITPPAGTVIYYSTSGNPCRGEVGGPTTSCDPPNWSTVPPSPITSVRSFKVEFGSRVVEPFDFLDFRFNMVAPASVPAGAPAFNSFAYQATRADGLGSLAAEPQKVGISLGSCAAAALGDFVFADTNSNGIQDDGATGLNNVMMRLFRPGPDGMQGTLDDVLLGTTVTANGPNAAPGWYNFPGLAPGNYFVCASLPPNYSFSPPDTAGDGLDSDAVPATGCSGIVTLAVNQTNNNLDVGLIPTQRATIGNYVWFDLNNDGIQNESPAAGANGVTVQLYARNGSDVLVATTVTANDDAHRPGYYSFSGLTPGQQYFVQFVLPASATAFTTANAGGDDTVDSDAAVGTGMTAVLTLAAGAFNRTLDAGLVRPTGTLGLGDQVWMDTDNDGVFEPENGELGMDGVLIHLYRDANGNGLPDAGEYTGQTTTSTESGFSGRYAFSELAAGNYIVVIPASNFAGGSPLAGKTSSTGNNPAPDPDDDANGDDNGRTVGTVLGSLPVTLTDNGEPTSEDGNNDTNLTVDFGFINSVVLPPTIAKAFGAPSVPVSGTTTLTFTLTNPNGGALSEIGFNDPLPAGLVVATPNGLTGSCVGMPVNPAVVNPGSVTAGAGSTSISMSSLALAGGGSCTLTVNTTVTAAGTKFNMTGNVIAADGVIGSTASATLLTNLPPTITPINLTRAAGSIPHTAIIGTAADAETPLNQLVVRLSTDGTNFFDNVIVGNVNVALLDQNPGAANVNPTAAGAVSATFTTPCNAVVGPLNLFLRVTDAEGEADTKPWTLTITANPPPMLSYANQSVIAGTTTSFNPATGPSDNGSVNPLVLQSISPATGLTLSLNPGSGQLAVTSATLVGNYSVTVSATDDCGAATNASFIVTVNCPPITLAPPTLPNGVQGTPYNQTVSAGPAGTTYSYAVTVNTLPPGLTLNSATGAITGTPAAAGNYAFAITATGWVGSSANGSGGCTKTQSYNLLITGTCATITVNPAALPGATVGAAYNQMITASPTGTYTFAVTQGALPLGLTLNTNTGAITGTATQGGSFSFRITATGPGGCTGSRTYVVTISCGTLTFTPPTLPNGTRGIAYNQQLSVSPGSSATFSLLLGSLPPGFTLNSAGLLSGTTSQTGTYNFTVRALAGTCQGTKAYALVIGGGTAALALSGDYDGDGQSDPTLWSAQDGVWRILLSGRSGDQQAVNQRWGTTGDVTLLGDYDGDGKSDLAVFRPSDATFYVQRSSDGRAFVKQWGLGTDVPVPGDYDGDGQTDIAVWRGSTGVWYILYTGRSSDGQYDVQAWGSASAPYHDVPVTGDYDGDGRTDVAVFRRGNGTWLIKRSTDGQAIVKAWGLGTDVPVAQDYDGDGKTDIAVWRGGLWYLWQSATQTYRVTEWGTTGDQMGASDYDGDGRADYAVWRPTAQTWYIHESATQRPQTRVQGQAADVPVAGRVR